MHWCVSHNDIIFLDFLGSVSFKVDGVQTLKLEDLGSWVKILERKVPGGALSSIYGSSSLRRMLWVKSLK